MAGSKSRRTALWGVLGALAVTVSLAENALSLPFLPPGAKIGLSNIIVAAAALSSGFWGAIYIAVVKVLFTFITRGATAFFMSAAGGLLSATVTAVLIRHFKRKFSFIGIGIAGALAHNGGQLCAAMLVTGTPGLIWYAPALALCALGAGIITGVILRCLNPYIEKFLIAKKQ